MKMDQTAEPWRVIIYSSEDVANLCMTNLCNKIILVEKLCMSDERVWLLMFIRVKGSMPLKSFMGSH